MTAASHRSASIRTAAPEPQTDLTRICRLGHDGLRNAAGALVRIGGDEQHRDVAIQPNDGCYRFRSGAFEQPDIGGDEVRPMNLRSLDGLSLTGGHVYARGAVLDQAVLDHHGNKGFVFDDEYVTHARNA